MNNTTNESFNETNRNIMKDLNEYATTVFLIITLIIFILWCLQNKMNYRNITKKILTFQTPIKNFENMVKWYVTTDNIIKKSNEIKKRRNSLETNKINFEEIPLPLNELNQLEINL
jgi:hypothetical protein